MPPLKVWSRFSVTKSDGTVENLRIQDMPQERYDDVMDFNIKYFAKYETFHRAAGVDKNPEALKECLECVSEWMRDSSTYIAVCCRDDTETVEDILGVSLMSLTTKDEDFDMDDIEFKTPEWKKYFDFLEMTHSMYDVLKEQNVDKSYDGRGIAVHPDYRGFGIATELFKVRIAVCKEQEVALTWACMTSLGSQKAAERAGWQTAHEISFADLQRQMGVSLEDAPPSCKLMYARI